MNTPFIAEVVETGPLTYNHNPLSSRGKVLPVGSIRVRPITSSSRGNLSLVYARPMSLNVLLPPLNGEHVMVFPVLSADESFGEHVNISYYYFPLPVNTTDDAVLNQIPDYNFRTPSKNKALTGGGGGGGGLDESGVNTGAILSAVMGTSETAEFSQLLESANILPGGLVNLASGLNNVEGIANNLMDRATSYINEADSLIDEAKKKVEAALPNINLPTDLTDIIPDINIPNLKVPENLKAFLPAQLNKVSNLADKASGLINQAANIGGKATQLAQKAGGIIEKSAGIIGKVSGIASKVTGAIGQATSVVSKFKGIIGGALKFIGPAAGGILGGIIAGPAGPLVTGLLKKIGGKLISKIFPGKGGGLLGGVGEALSGGFPNITSGRNYIEMLGGLTSAVAGQNNLPVIPGNTFPFPSRPMRPLQPYEGDVIMQNRTGSALRLGNGTQRDSQYGAPPDFHASTNLGSPLFSLTCEEPNAPKTRPLVETPSGIDDEVNTPAEKQASQSYRTENLKRIPTGIYGGVTLQVPSIVQARTCYIPARLKVLGETKTVPEFKGAQIIHDSDRVVINAKRDNFFALARKRIVLEASKIFLITDQHIVDVDDLVNDVQQMAEDMLKLVTGLFPLAAVMGPTGQSIPQAIANFTRTFASLSAMNNRCTPPPFPSQSGSPIAEFGINTISPPGSNLSIPGAGDIAVTGPTGTGDTGISINPEEGEGQPGPIIGIDPDETDQLGTGTTSGTGGGTSGGIGTPSGSPGTPGGPGGPFGPGGPGGTPGSGAPGTPGGPGGPGGPNGPGGPGGPDGAGGPVGPGGTGGPGGLEGPGGPSGPGNTGAPGDGGAVTGPGTGGSGTPGGTGDPTDPQTCTYTVHMLDQRGLGWEQAFIQIKINGTDYTRISTPSYSQIRTFTIAKDQEISFIYNDQAGDEPFGYLILFENEVLFTNGLDPNPGLIYETKCSPQRKPKDEFINFIEPTDNQQSPTIHFYEMNTTEVGLRTGVQNKRMRLVALITSGKDTQGWYYVSGPPSEFRPDADQNLITRNTLMDNTTLAHTLLTHLQTTDPAGCNCLGVKATDVNISKLPYTLRYKN